jgi:DNA invertase Pin-like site-specific DNA recombinase
MAKTSMPKTFGYVRVSTAKQNLDRQLVALESEGIRPEDIYSDKISGVKTKRPGLDSLLKVVRPGDIIVVHSLDRLGRSAMHILQTIHDLTEAGISIKSLKNSEDLTSVNGRLMVTIFSAIAEWEREIINERAAEAREARRGKGEHVGRPLALTPSQVTTVRLLKQNGHRPTDIARDMGVSRATVYRALEQA